MDQTRLDAIRARCEAATPGPWTLEKMGRYEDHDECRIELADDSIELSRYENGEFVAASRTDVPDLLQKAQQLTAELAAMTAERDEARLEIDRMTDAYDLKMRVHDALNRDYVALREVHTTLNGIMCGIRDDRDAWKARAEAAERDIEKMLHSMPLGMCKQFCKRTGSKCGAWADCAPEWRGPEEEKPC